MPAFLAAATRALMKLILTLLLWECPQDKWCAGVVIEMITAAKGPLELCDLEARRCLLIGNELLLQHIAVRLISFGVI